MNIRHTARLSSLVTALAVVSSFGMTAVASAAPVSTTNTPTTNVSSKDAAKLKAVIADGDTKITVRLERLNKLGAKVYTTTKLSADKKAALLAEIGSSVDGLKALKTKLDAETTVTAAQADFHLIFTDYRVYLLVVPKVHLVKVADNELAKEANIADLLTLMQSYIAAHPEAASQTSTVNDLQTRIKASQATTQDLESKLLVLKPSDYNSNHDLMKGYLSQLQKIHTENVAIYKAAVAVINKVD